MTQRKLFGLAILVGSFLILSVSQATASGQTAPSATAPSSLSQWPHPVPDRATKADVQLDNVAINDVLGFFQLKFQMQLMKSFPAPMAGNITIKGTMSTDEAVAALTHAVEDLGYSVELIRDWPPLLFFTPKGQKRDPNAQTYSAVTSPAAAPRPADPEPGFAGAGSIAWGNPYQFIKQNGDAVYLATVRSYAASPGPARGPIRGTATLQIKAVLRGDKVDSLTLPFTYAGPPSPTPGPIPSLWPDLSKLPDDYLILLVVGTGPNPNDRTATAPIKIAQFVHPVAGTDSPVARDYKSILALANVPESELKDALLKAVRDNPYRPLSQYILGAAAAELQRADYVEITCELIRHYKYPYNMQLDSTFSSFIDLDLKSPTCPKPTRDRILATLTAGLQSHDTDEVRNTLEEWRHLTNVLPDKASEFFDQASRRDLLDALAAAKATLSTEIIFSRQGTVDKIAAVQKWLDSKNP